MEDITISLVMPEGNNNPTQKVGADVTTVSEYLGTIQASALEVWKLHLLTNDYNEHIVLNDYYDDIIDLADDLIEHYMGVTETPLDKLENGLCAEGGNATEYLSKLRDFVRKGVNVLGDEVPSEIKSDVDAILGLLDSTLYKLKNLIHESKVAGYGKVPSFADFLIESESYDFKKNDDVAEYCFSFENDKEDVYNYDVLFEDIVGTNDVRVRFNFNVNGLEYDTTNDEFAGLNQSYVESVVNTIGDILEEYLKDNEGKRLVIHTDGNTMEKKYRIFVNYAVEKFGEDSVNYDTESNTITITPNAESL